MNKLYTSLVVITTLFFGGAFYIKSHETPRLGVAQEDFGGKHVQHKIYNGTEPPTSGDHAAPIAWGVYDTPQEDVNTLHNLEHGGIYITYTDSLPKNDLEQLKNLVDEPFSQNGFTPAKVIVAPRLDNDSVLTLSSWNRSLKLDKYDKQTIINYYNTNVNKSPEPLAG